jgi:hypothetical protein
VAVTVLPLPLYAATNGKKLIEFGFDQPDTAFMVQHITEMERMPFDGTVFTANLNNGYHSITDYYWGGAAFTANNMTKALKDLRATPFHKFTDNFLRLKVSAGGDTPSVDWFDDFTTIINNSRAVGRLARDAGVKGVFIDVEPYHQQIWWYDLQRYAAEKTWDDYVSQVRLRGYQIAKAFQQGYPNLTVFLTFGYSLPFADLYSHNIEVIPENLWFSKYGLLAPFLDGFCAAMHGKAKVVDGYELSYGYKRPEDFANGYNFMKSESGVLPIVADDAKYLKFLSAGFAVWMDYRLDNYTWHTAPSEFDLNYYTPAELQTALETAISQSDKYVWLYTEVAWWWTTGGGTRNLTDAYIDAVEAARATVPRRVQ